MTREDAKRYWTAKYEAASKWDDPHWEASERKEHRRYVDALKAAIEALSVDTSQDLAKPRKALKVSDLVHRGDAYVESAEAVQGWIPCSERLPSEERHYLCCNRGYLPFTAHYHDGQWHCFDGTTSHVDAWMPLPEAYKGGDDE